MPLPLSCCTAVMPLHMGPANDQLMAASLVLCLLFAPERRTQLPCTLANHQHATMRACCSCACHLLLIGRNDDVAEALKAPSAADHFRSLHRIPSLFSAIRKVFIRASLHPPESRIEGFTLSLVLPRTESTICIVCMPCVFVVADLGQRIVSVLSACASSH